MTPITKKILTKSGWITNIYCCYLYVLDDMYFSYHKNGDFFLVITNSDTESDCEELFQKLDIKYIEQIKDLYKALTNQELNILS